MLLAIAAFAQKGLNIAKFFNDDFLSKSGISSVNISGAQLERLNSNLTLYRNVSVENDEKIANEMEKAVKKDGVEAASRTVTMNDGHVVFGLYAFPAEGTTNRFIIFTQNCEKQNDTQTENTARADLFYIEGEITAAQLTTIIRQVQVMTRNRNALYGNPTIYTYPSNSPIQRPSNRGRARYQRNGTNNRNR